MGEFSSDQFSSDSRTVGVIDHILPSALAVKPVPASESMHALEAVSRQVRSAAVRSAA